MVLAARARRPGGDRVPRAGEHLHARRARTPRIAARRALRRDRGTRPGDRHDRTDPSRRLRVLHPHTRRPPVRRALPSPRDRRPAPRSPRGAGNARARARRPRRERAGRGPRLLRGGRSRRRPGAGGRGVQHRHERRRALRPALPRAARRRGARGSGARRHRARRLLRRGVGERWRHHPLHASRRGHAPVADLAARARDVGRRRPARVPGGRRPLLRERQSHAQRSLPRDHLGLEGDDGDLAGRRRRPHRTAGDRRAARTGARVPRRAPRGPGRRPSLRPHQRRRGGELRARRSPRSPHRAAPRGRPSSRSGTTPASTTSTRSPASWSCRSAPTPSNGSTS